jgi:hypothetical protein
MLNIPQKPIYLQSEMLVQGCIHSLCLQCIYGSLHFQSAIYIFFAKLGHLVDGRFLKHFLFTAFLKISSRFDSKNETQILKGGLSLQIKLYRAVEKSLL